jgi:hypothetical protein
MAEQDHVRILPSILLESANITPPDQKGTRFIIQKVANRTTSGDGVGR